MELTKTGRTKTRAGIRAVAEAAGVSIATVSRVINSPELVSQETRDKVREAMLQCNYSVPAASQNKAASDVKTIALFVFDIASPFYIALTKEFLRLSYEYNFNLVICESSSSVSKEKLLDYCSNIHASGIVYSASYEMEELPLNSDISIPMVLIDHAPFADYPTYNLISDNEKAIQLLVTYLRHLNHERIAFIGCRSTVSLYSRYEYFQKTLLSAQGQLNPDYIHLSDAYDEKAGIEAFDKFYSLAEPPTAIIAASDQIAHGFILRALSLGVRIPQDFSVCGIDGVSEQYYPPITSVRQNISAMAAKACAYLLHPESVTLPCREIIDVAFQSGQTCTNI